MNQKSCGNCQCYRWTMEDDWEEAQTLDEVGIECSLEQISMHDDFGASCQFFQDIAERDES